MSPGVNFTRKTAKRIENVVHTVERSPRAEPTLQRQRAGGLGRLSLWEVTAVQTGPKTVTLQRIENSDMDLITVRDREDIFYNPDAKPSVGDRGLVIRLGDGSLFFFRRAIIKRRFFDEHCYVEPANPNTAFGFPTQAKLKTQSDNTIERIAVLKFTSRVPQTLDDTGGFTAVSLGKANITNLGTAAIVFTGTALTKFRLSLTAIQQDFDPSSLTYNDYIALTQSSWFTNSVLDINMNSVGNVSIQELTIQEFSPLSPPGGVFIHSDIFGLAISGQWTDPFDVVSGNMFGTIIRQATFLGNYRSWMEWLI